MKLTPQEQQYLDGKHGGLLQKMMKTIYTTGIAMKAEKLVALEGPSHLAIPWAMHGVGPRVEFLKLLADAGLKARQDFSINPRSALDFENLGLNREQEEDLSRLYATQNAYDREMASLGLMSADCYTCTPYLPEVMQNQPSRGTILAWAESSCIVFANSVLGARTNRTATIIDLLSAIMGKTPYAGLLTDEGRKASWLVKLALKAKPSPHLLGGVIGARVMTDTPFIVGLDSFLGTDMTPDNMDYLKDMGAGCAAIGGIGLYHVEGLTPEAKDHGRALLHKDHQTFVIDDQILAEVFASYSCLWADKNADPCKCLIGCPHLSLRELNWWADALENELQKQGQKQVALSTVICAAPKVLAQFKEDTSRHRKLTGAGVLLSASCHEMLMNSSKVSNLPTVTNSNKLRAYTTARMFLNDDLVRITVSGKIGD